MSSLKGLSEGQRFLIALIRILNLEGSWSGGTHIQKCAFFLKELWHLPVKYSFVIHRYGPYSFDLEDELAILRCQGWIKAQPGIGGYGVHYRIGPSIEFTETDIPNTAESNAIRSFVGSLGKLNVRELELYATTFYFKKGVDGRKRSDETTIKDVIALKPHFKALDVDRALHRLSKLERKVRSSA